MRRTKKSSQVIEEKIKPKRRKRTLKPEPSKKYICGAANSCWFRGQCPHREPHERLNCGQDFCSVINLKNCICEEVV
jgi:hypothetical protein